METRHQREYKWPAASVLPQGHGFRKGYAIKVMQSDVDIALELLYKRPRKCLNYRTPAETAPAEAAPVEDVVVMEEEVIDDEVEAGEEEIAQRRASLQATRS